MAVIEHTEELGSPTNIHIATVALDSDISVVNKLSEASSDLPELESGIFGGNIVALMTGGVLWNR